MAKQGIRFADLFAGLGGFHLAAAQLGGRCVYACEIDPKLREAYHRNFGITPAGDIRQAKPDDLPKHDLLCAGFPCQPFSKAGAQRGWLDAVRGTVFHDIVKILEVHRPSFVLLENVAHFVRHDQGNTYHRAKEALSSLGYDVRSTTLSPHWFGVPQIRERMYLVGRLGGLDGFDWPTPTTRGHDLRLGDILDVQPADARGLSGRVVRCLETWQEFLDLLPQTAKLPSFPIWSMEFRATYPCDHDSLGDIPLSLLRQKRGCFGQPLDAWFRRDILQRVPSHARGSRAVFPRWKQTFIRQNREFYQEHRSRLWRWLPKIQQFPPSWQKLEWNCQGEKRDIWRYVIQFRASGVRIKRPTTSPSLVAMTTTQVPIIGWERRYMTVRECARLQSMGELEHCPPGEAAMTALGNAVNVTVARLVLEKLLNVAGPRALSRGNVAGLRPRSNGRRQELPA
jgi:DNA (cytosine-5)-methyltransferase 1